MSAGDVPAANQIWRLIANPSCWLTGASPMALQAKARSTSKSVPSLSM
jgi:hypothetical protein